MFARVKDFIKIINKFTGQEKENTNYTNQIPLSPFDKWGTRGIFIPL
jgi:hypothetical protein